MKRENNPVIASQCAHWRGNPPAGGTLDFVYYVALTAGSTDCHTSDIGHWFAMTNYQPCVKQLSMMNRTSIADYINKIGAAPHDSSRANPEKICGLTMTLFCRHTLCMARKSDEGRAQIFREAPKANYVVLPRERKQLRDGGTDLMALRDRLKKKKGYEG